MGTVQAFVWKKSVEELWLELLQRSDQCSIESVRRGLFDVQGVAKVCFLSILIWIFFIINFG